MKVIGGNINHRKPLNTKMPPIYGISIFILTGQSRHIDQTVVENHDRAGFLIDMSVPSDTNVSLKIFEN